jgi:hypothetical protein
MRRRDGDPDCRLLPRSDEAEDGEGRTRMPLAWDAGPWLEPCALGLLTPDTDDNGAD